MSAARDPLSYEGPRGRNFFEEDRVLQRALEAEREACVDAYFRAMRLVEAADPAAEALVPLLKIELSRRATAAVRRAQLLIGGHGALEEFTILPRLAEHAAKALRRPAGLAAFLKALPQGAAAAGSELSARVEKSRAMSEDERSLDNLDLCGLAFRVFSA